MAYGWLVSILLVLVSPSISLVHGQSQVNIIASKDNTLYESATGALSNGSGEHFFAGRSNQVTGSIRRGLLAFNVAGSVPSGATITSAALTLSMSQTGPGSGTVSLHRVLASWGEGPSLATGNEGGGAPADTGDATWLHTFYDTMFWTTPGGDFSPTPSAAQTVGALGTYTWGPTSQMVADVQQWLNTPGTSFGWVLIGNESLSQSSKRFDARENVVPANRPSLVITYTTTSVAESSIPETFSLSQNYPNPFNPSTTIAYRVRGHELVSLKIFDLLGREVMTLVKEVKSPGAYEAAWDAGELTSGVYWYQLRSGPHTETRKMILLR